MYTISVDVPSCTLNPRASIILILSLNFQYLSAAKLGDNALGSCFSVCLFEPQSKQVIEFAVFVCPYVMMYSTAYKSGQFSCPSVHLFGVQQSILGARLCRLQQKKKNNNTPQVLSKTWQLQVHILIFVCLSVISGHLWLRQRPTVDLLLTRGFAPNTCRC